MTEQSKPSGDQTPWWVDQASEIIAPSGPLPAKTQPGQPKAPAAAEAPAKPKPATEKPVAEAEPKAQEQAPQPEAEAPKKEAPAAAPPKSAEEDLAPQFEESDAGGEDPAGDGDWEIALQDLDESCGQVRRQIKELNELHTEANAETLSSLESPIRSLQDAVRELSELGPSTDTDAEGADRTPTLRGFTASLPISSILELLSANLKTGTLNVTSDGEHFTLEILEGDVVHASSDRSTREQLLGSILVARDKIGVEQLEDFYKRYTQSSGDDDAGHETLVSREDLMSALEEQVQELFNRLYSEENGSFCFYEGGSSNVEQRIRMKVTTLLLESARKKDELERQPETAQPDETEPS